jgi:hypothetical protein
LEALQKLMLENKDTVNHLAREWQEQYPEHERTRIIQFLQHTFGLETIKPIPVKLSDISLGFEGSEYHHDACNYHIKYREAQE